MPGKACDHYDAGFFRHEDFLFIVVGVVIYLFVYGGTGRVGGPMSPLVGVTYRDSYVGAGIVMDIANQSGKTLYRGACPHGRPGWTFD